MSISDYANHNARKFGANPKPEPKPQAQPDYEVIQYTPVPMEAPVAQQFCDTQPDMLPMLRVRNYDGLTVVEYY